MTLEQLLEALGKLPEGSRFAEAIKALIAAKESEVASKGNQYKTLAKTLKETEDKLKASTERLAKFYDHTGIDEGAEDIEASLAEYTKGLTKEGGQAAPEIAQLQKDITKLQKDLKKATEGQSAFEKLAGEERTKRQNSERNRSLLAALTEHKAIKPDQLLKILADKVKINDDDTLSFLKEDGEEIEVSAGVKAWLDANPEFSINSQNAGAGGGGGGGGGNKSTFAEALLKSGQPSERLQQAENHYFGNSNN